MFDLPTKRYNEENLLQMHKEPQACASASLKLQFLTADLFKSI